MSELKALIFDTNFIIQNNNLNHVVEQLKEKYAVYIAQVTIDERIGQQCRDLKTKYDEAEKNKKKYEFFATLEFIKSYEEMCDLYKKSIQEKYEKCFDKNIIPLKKEVKTLNTIIERANKRIPPFSANKNASDKGFKDCLLWLAVLSYFKNKGEKEVIFLTDDNAAFLNNKDYLEKEFKDITNKTISIKQNEYYKEISNKQEACELEKTINDDSEEMPNLSVFRNELDNVVKGLREIEELDFYGNSQWIQTFKTSIPFDKNYMKDVFSELYSNLSKYIFETTIPASSILDHDGRVVDLDAEVPMENFEKVLQIYKTVQQKYPQYIEQFFEAVAKILNNNYDPSLNSNNLEDEGYFPF